MSLKKDNKAGKMTPLPLNDCSNKIASRNSNQRFQVVSSPDREKATKGAVSAKTEASSQWALKNFTNWADHCNLNEPDQGIYWKAMMPI